MSDDFGSLNALRRNLVVKDNRLIQHSRHKFTVQQQKILLYVVSQLDSQKQETFTEQTFEIADFCRVCDINFSGKNYRDLKSALLDMTSKVFWIQDGDREITARWIDRAIIERKSGRVTIKLDDMMKPFLLELSEKFTRYNLIYTLTMRSKYAVRLYELLKSFEGLGAANFDIPRFKTLIDAGYSSWGELNRRAIKPAVDEINEVSDIQVQYEGRRGHGAAFETINFTITPKLKFKDKTETERAIYQRLTGKKSKPTPPQIEGQLSLD